MGRQAESGRGVVTAVDTVRIGVLGPLEVTGPAGQPVPVGGQRVRALLILLALDAGRAVPARALIERLWLDGQPAGAANALQSLVSRLRVALRRAGVPDSVLESTPAGYRLSVPPGAVDALAFEARARAGGEALARGDTARAATLLREALTLWRGPALADVAEEEFAFAPAARLAELRLAAVLDRIEADLALGAAGAPVLAELRELTVADPLAERPAALLIRALAAAGRQAEALSCYHQVRGQLADRLGVDPSAALEQAYLAVLRQEVPAPAAVPAHPERGVPAPDPHQLATFGGASGVPRRPGGGRPLTSFVGRDEDIAGVLKKLSAGPLITLTGPGGVGKTRLAGEVVAQLPVPAWFAELAPVTDPSEVPYAVLDALGLRGRSIARPGAEPRADPVGRLCAALAERDVVLILDNCEHVIDAAASLAGSVLDACPRVRVLATSREPLRIPGETLHPVSPLPVPAAGPVPAADWVQGAASAYPALRLFTDRAAAVVPGFELGAGNAAAVTQICRTLDGIPLAIELAAPWLRTLTPAQLAERLDDRFTLLTGGSRTALPRHQTLRAVVDWSWHLLSSAERALARRLAIFPGGATLAAAEQVCAGPDLPRRDVLSALSGLVAKSILTPVEGGRYRMLETIRAYCLQRLAEAAEESWVRDAFAAFCVDFTETADPRLRTAAQARWFRDLAAELDNAHAALRWAVSRGDAATALRLVRALGYFWVQRSHCEGDVLAREVLALGPPEEVTRPIAEARVICALLAAGWSWDIGSVRAELNAAIAGLAPWGSDLSDFHPLVALAQPMLMQFDGDFELAKARYDWYAGSRDPWLRAMGRLYRGTYGLSAGQLAGAEDECHAALREFRVLGDRWATALALASLNDFTELRADHAASIAVLEEAAGIIGELDAWGELTYVHAKLAVIRARAGDTARAYTDLDQADRMLAAHGGRDDTGQWVTFLRAEVAWLDGDLDGAARCCETVLGVIGAHDHAWWQAMRAHVKVRLAMVALRQENRRRCARLLAEAADAAAAWPERPPLASVLDACASFALGLDGPGGGARTAARLLGAAHAVRGAFDESSLDAPAVRAAAREALGAAAFDAAYQSSRELTHAPAVALAREFLAAAQIGQDTGG